MSIHPDIRKSHTLNASVYADPAVFQALKDAVFARCWHWVADAEQLRIDNNVLPVTLLEGYLDEPLLLTNESGELRCMSNVCTHRGNLLVRHPGQLKGIVCSYHGRKFGLDGGFRFMPEFKEADDFPSPCDDLPRLPLHNWRNLLFTALEPVAPFDKLFGDMEKRIGWLPVEQFRFEPRYSQDYLVNANWKLYCDNYLEGFHIPYVHHSLNQVIDYQSYTTELFPWSSLQLGLAKGGEESFDLPESSPDYGKKVAAYYFWVFPNMMFNFYPWGCSVNIVKPLQVGITRVSFRTYIWKPEKFNAVTASLLERVEREDEDIVEQVQKGVRSRLYKRGRFSPEREQGVHHFHRLLDRLLGETGG